MSRASAGSRPVRPRRATAALVLCAVIGLASWVFYSAALVHVPFQDWMVYDTASRSFFAGDVSLLFDGPRFMAQLNRNFAGWLSQPLSFHPWVYPPHFLLLLLPFGLLPPGVAYGLFLTLTFTGAAAAAWRFAATGRRRALFAASLALCPAAAFDFWVGQNGFLSGGLLVGGFGLLSRSPVLGGALLGILSYKPQLWLMVPVALVAARQWRALASALAMALLMVGVSAAVFGIETWRHWFAFSFGGNAIYLEWIEAGRLKGMSVYACAVLFGAAPAVANLLQAAAVLIAAACVYWSNRRVMPEGLRLAVLLSATILAAPHVSNYDCILLAMAATLLLMHGFDNGFRFGDTTLIVSVWVWPLFNPPSVFHLGLATPLLIVVFLAVLIGRAREAAPRRVRDRAEPARHRPSPVPYRS